MIEAMARSSLYGGETRLVFPFLVAVDRAASWNTFA